MKKTWIFAVLAAMAMGLAVFGCSNGDSSSESVRDFGKGTYKLDGTFENGTIHLHQTHASSTSGWVEHVEDMTLAVKDGKFTVDMGEIITFTKVGSSSSSGSGTGSESGSTGGTTSGGGSESGSTGGSSSGGGSSSESVVFQSSRFGDGTLQIEYKADGTFLMTLSEGDYSAASARKFGKGTYRLDGTFENGTIHQRQTHSSDTNSSEWVEEEVVEDETVTVKDGKFTVDAIGLTFTKVGSSSSSW